jgi:hypothetical protein
MSAALVINNPTRDLSFGASLAGSEKLGVELNGGRVVVSSEDKISGVVVISFLLVCFLYPLE